MEIDYTDHTKEDEKLDTARSTQNLITNENESTETSFTVETKTTTTSTENSSASSKRKKKKQRKPSALASSVSDSNFKNLDLLETPIEEFCEGDVSDDMEPKRKISSYDIRVRRMSQRKRSVAQTVSNSSTTSLMKEKADSDDTSNDDNENDNNFRVPLMKRRSGTFTAPNTDFLGRSSTPDQQEPSRNLVSAGENIPATPRNLFSKGTRTRVSNDVPPLDIPAGYSTGDSVDSVMMTDRILQRLKMEEEKLLHKSQTPQEHKSIKTRPSNLSTVSNRSGVTLKDLHFFDVTDDGVTDENEAELIANRFARAVNRICSPSASSASGNISSHHLGGGSVFPKQSLSPALHHLKKRNRKKSKAKNKKSVLK